MGGVTSRGAGSGPARRVRSWRRRGGGADDSEGLGTGMTTRTDRGDDVDVPERQEPQEDARGRRRPDVRSLGARLGRRWPVPALALWTLVVWSRPILRDPANLRLSNPGDSESFSLYLSWNVHALTHGKNPFFLDNLYAPQGMDLGNALSLPSVSLLVAPITAAFGGTAGYNAAFLLAVLAGAVAVYLLARELTGSVVGSTLAGALMVVSPYVTGHALGHLNLQWTFGLPLLAWLLLRWYREKLRTAWLVVDVALVVAFTIGASTELLVTQSLFAVAGLVVAWIALPAPRRARLLRGVPWLALGVVAGVAVASPVIIAGLRSGIPVDVGNDPGLYSSDLTNLLAPTHLTLVGDSFFAGLREGWQGNEAENTAYLPLTLVALVVASAVAVRSRLQAALWAFGGLALVASFGPHLLVAGHATVPMPWAVLEKVPGLDHALPGRFSQFLFMALCVLVAVAWAHRGRWGWLVGAAVAATVVLLLPNFTTMLIPAGASDPEPETIDVVREVVEPGENVLVMPVGQWGPGMRWMDDLDFTFDMPSGNGGGAAPPEGLKDPVAAALFATDLDYDYASTLPDYLDRVGVDLVLVDARYPDWLAVAQESLPVPGVERDGVWVFDLG